MNGYSAFSAKRMLAQQFRRLVETQILPRGEAKRDGKTLTNFSSNDYLGLSQHAKLIKRAQDYTTKYGVGATASRLITGNNPLHTVIEEKIAEGKGTEAALVLGSGYQANLTVLAALADTEVMGRPVTVIADRLSHHSLLQGAQLGGARLTRFKHNDYGHLETLLRQQKDRDAHVIIVSESVFGMDGDCADLPTLIAMAKQHHAMLYIDEAHATGLYGPKGFGFCAQHKGADVAMGTFGKALGSYGSYIACSKVLRDYLVQRCGGLIYSTALPPSVLGAIEAALELIPQMDSERDYVQTQANRLRRALTEQGWNTGGSSTHIIPTILGHEEAAGKLAERLEKDGILAPAIRPPTVPAGTSRIRFSVSAAHDVTDIDYLITVMARMAEIFAVRSPEAVAS